MTDSKKGQLMLASGMLLHHRYRIIGLLGQGGMGAVYLAEDENLPGRRVALKENFDLSLEAQEQFHREALILARLRHPHLPQVTDHFIEPSGRQYLTMEFVDGEDLEQILAQRGPLPEAEALDYILQVCGALEYMHTWVDPATNQLIPIIHRDIKPGNLKRTPQGQIVLVDFGIAKYQTGTGTQTRARAVSPGFSPIEQYSGGTDPRSDIYALGATLYCLLTGRVPPEATQIAVGSPLLPPRQLNPAISVQVEQVILRAVQLRAVDRYQSVRELRQALNAAMAAPPMPYVCAACGATNRPAARFCAACGANLGQPGRQLPVVSAVAVDDLVSREGTMVAVVGQVTEIHCGQSQQGPYVFLNFGDWRSGCFKAVAWYETLQKFSAAGIDLAAYRGQWLSVVGEIKLWKGVPEIVLSAPVDVEVLGGPAEAQRRLGSDPIANLATPGPRPHPTLPSDWSPPIRSMAAEVARPQVQPADATSSLPPRRLRGLTASTEGDRTPKIARKSTGLPPARRSASLVILWLALILAGLLATAGLLMQYMQTVGPTPR